MGAGNTRKKLPLGLEQSNFVNKAGRSITEHQRTMHQRKGIDKPEGGLDWDYLAILDELIFMAEDRIDNRLAQLEDLKGDLESPQEASPSKSCEKVAKASPPKSIKKVAKKTKAK